MSVIVGKEGRIVLPKKIREKHGVEEGMQLILREHGGQIVLIPVSKYTKPTEALHGSVEAAAPIDQPKEEARKHLRKKLLEELR